MLQSDIEYYRRRAAAERELARTATSPASAAIHAELARGYDALAENPEATGARSASG